MGLQWKRGERVTFKEACEYVAAVAREKTGLTMDPEVFFNASPTGELVHVLEAYWSAKMQTACDRPGCPGKHRMVTDWTPGPTEGNFEYVCAEEAEKGGSG